MRPSIREQIDEVSLKKKQYLRLSMLDVGKNRVVFTCDDFFQMSWDVISEVVLHVLCNSRLLYVVLKNKKQQYPNDDIELVQL